MRTSCSTAVILVSVPTHQQTGRLCNGLTWPLDYNLFSRRADGRAVPLTLQYTPQGHFFSPFLHATKQIPTEQQAGLGTLYQRKPRSFWGEVGALKLKRSVGHIITKKTPKTNFRPSLGSRSWPQERRHRRIFLISIKQQSSFRNPCTSRSLL